MRRVCTGTPVHHELTTMLSGAGKSSRERVDGPRRALALHVVPRPAHRRAADNGTRQRREHCNRHRHATAAGPLDVAAQVEL